MKTLIEKLNFISKEPNSKLVKIEIISIQLRDMMLNGKN